MLSGDAGWGKSSLMKILGTMIGWNNVGIIRENLFKDEFELAHYYNKRPRMNSWRLALLCRQRLSDLH